MLRLRYFATYTDTLKVTLKVLCFKFTVVPKSEKKKKRKEAKVQKYQQKQKEYKEAGVETYSEAIGLEGMLSILKDLVVSLKEVIKYVNIKKFDFNIVIRGEDAADTALKYGKTCSVFYTAVAAILGAAKFKDYNLNLKPDFDEDKPSELDCQVNFQIRLIYVIRYLLGVYLRLYRIGFRM